MKKYFLGQEQPKNEVGISLSLFPKGKQSTLYLLSVINWLIQVWPNLK